MPLKHLKSLTVALVCKDEIFFQLFLTVPWLLTRWRQYQTLLTSPATGGREVRTSVGEDLVVWLWSLITSSTRRLVRGTSPPPSSSCSTTSRRPTLCSWPRTSTMTECLTVLVWRCQLYQYWSHRILMSTSYLENIKNQRQDHLVIIVIKNNNFAGFPQKILSLQLCRPLPGTTLHS